MRPRSRSATRLVVVTSVVALACAHATRSPRVEIEADGPVVLRGPTLIDGTGAAPAENVSIVLSNGRIRAVGPAGAIPIPDGARVIDARDRWVIPGLWDLHVHLGKAKAEALPVLLGHGITSVRDMGGDLEEIRSFAARVAAGEIPGPRIWTPGPMLETPATMERMRGTATHEPWRRTRVPVPDTRSAARVVDSLAELGVDFVKIREAVSNETYAAIAAAARDRGLDVAGHAPYGMDPVEAADLGIVSIEHASYPYPLDTLPARRREILDAFVRAGTAIVPTLAAWRTHRMHPDSLAILVGDTAGRRDPRRPTISDFLAHEWAVDLADMEPKSDESLAGWKGFLDRTGADLAAMHAAGIPILPGSDLAGVGLFPGASLHEELEALVDCVGMTPMEAIEAATRQAATLLGAEDSLGTVEPGKRADLVVLDADPTVDVAHARSIVAIVKDGRWYGRDEIRAMLGGLAPTAGGDIGLLPRRTGPPRGCARPRPPTRAILDVNVVPMDRDTVLAGHVVVIEGDRIAWIGPAGETPIPAGAERIDGRGGYLMPGLVESHAHAGAEALPLYVASGVTTVRILSGSPERLAERDRVRADPSLPWPSLIVAGPLLAGEEVPWSHELVEGPAAARRLVDAHAEAGYDALKIYDGLSREAYDAIVERARELEIPLVGHVPVDVGLERVIEAGQTTVEHAEQILYAAFGRDGVMSLPFERLDAALAAFEAADRPPCVTPTLHGMTAMMRRGTAFTDSLYGTVDRTLVDPDLEGWWDSYRGEAAPEAVERRGHFLELQSRLTAALRRAGVPILAGTDTPYPLLVPGRSLASEIGALTEAGLSGYEALAAATSNAPGCHGASGLYGVVAEGARADLLLVREDPRISAGTLRRPVGVMLRGRWLDAEDLRELEEGVRSSYAGE